MVFAVSLSFSGRGSGSLASTDAVLTSVPGLSISTVILTLPFSPASIAPSRQVTTRPLAVQPPVVFTTRAPGAGGP